MLITLQPFQYLLFPAFTPLSHLLLYFYNERYLIGAELLLAFKLFITFLLIYFVYM